jgi:hypothetical protein
VNRHQNSGAGTFRMATGTKGKLPTGPIPDKRAFGLTWCGCLLVSAAAIALAIQFGRRTGAEAYPSTLGELLQLSPARLSQAPIAELNLLCASGLCVSNEPSIKQCMTTIHVWAQHIQSETERHRYRFERNPAEFENSPGFFRMLMLAVVLEEDYGVHYDPQRMAGPADSRMDEAFFSDPRSVFLHGLLGPERIGTCSSLPVLFVAVGRQLGYPLKLVTTKGHLFVRWEGAGERFNVETTGRGLNRFDDEYYRRWPFEISAAEAATEGYLKSLTRSEELAVFLSVRGMCLRAANRLPEAAESFTAAAHLAPRCQGYQHMLASLESTLRRQTRGTNSSPTSMASSFGD